MIYAKIIISSFFCHKWLACSRNHRLFNWDGTLKIMVLKVRIYSCIQAVLDKYLLLYLNHGNWNILSTRTCYMCSADLNHSTLQQIHVRVSHFHPKIEVRGKSFDHPPLTRKNKGELCLVKVTFCTWGSDFLSNPMYVSDWEKASLSFRIVLCGSWRINTCAYMSVQAFWNRD